MNKEINVHEFRKSQLFNESINAGLHLCKFGANFTIENKDWRYLAEFTEKMLIAQKSFFEAMILVDPWDDFWKKRLSETNTGLGLMESLKLGGNLDGSSRH